LWGTADGTIFYATGEKKAEGEFWLFKNLSADNSEKFLFFLKKGEEFEKSG
jgi:hypothetical protein